MIPAPKNTPAGLSMSGGASAAEAAPVCGRSVVEKTTDVHHVINN